MAIITLRRAVQRVRNTIFPRAGGAFGTEQVLQEEAKAIHGADTAKLTGKELNRALNKLNSAALCLSGGGIRSACLCARRDPSVGRCIRVRTSSNEAQE